MCGKDTWLAVKEVDTGLAATLLRLARKFTVVCNTGPLVLAYQSIHQSLSLATRSLVLQTPVDLGLAELHNPRRLILQRAPQKEPVSNIDISSPGLTG